MASTTTTTTERRDLDVVVYGASGFTGQRVLETLVRLAPHLKVGAAGRDAAKLSAVAARVAAAADVLVADANDPAALERVARRARLVLACAGPFRLYGGPLAEACVRGGADYLDISGEPEYLEKIELELAPGAERAGVFLASACAFDSVPNDLGTLFVQRQFAAPRVCSSVDSVVSVLPGPSGYRINYATYESAVLGIAQAQGLRALRGRAARARAERDAALPRPPPRPLGPRPPKPAEGPTFDKALGVYTLPFPGADASVVRRTQAELARRAAEGDATAEPPVYFGARFSVGASLANVAAAVACGGAFFALASKGGDWGRRLLLEHPGLFSCGLVSRQGPTERQMDEVTTQLTFVGKGYATREAAAAGGPPTETVRARVTMGDLGYKGTSLIFACAALTLLEERGALEAATGRKGGVYTAGALFRRSTLLERLQAVGGMKFEVVA
jgi:short subunit dehydrogenase-like uncharacterized protein